MPALSSLVTLLATQANQSLPTAGTEQSNVSSSAVETVQVVCAWPVSGQYGPGSRFLYYALVAACLFGRQEEWLRNACLAAALLLPAVAALHGIVLAAVHVDGAVDMDIYGSFQLCAIGVLAGPVTVRLSETYFNAPGRNMIFVWTVMILAGLLSLTVEFFRTNVVPCPANEFTWNADDTSICGLTCSVEQGPFSPIRGGAQNNIYVIQAPNILTFGSATLLAAASCVPAILSLVSTWTKIQKENWTRLFGGARDSSEDIHAPIAGTNNATKAGMNNINTKVTWLLSMVEVPVFGTIVLLIIIFGERNFFSYRVAYNTEPIASVGQWSPIVATGLAAAGSLYNLLADPKRHRATHGKEDECDCPHDRHHSEDCDSYPGPHRSTHRIIHDRSAGGDSNIELRRPTDASSVSPTRRYPTNGSQDPSSEHHEHLRRSDTVTTENTTRVASSRLNVARTFERVGHILGTPAPDRFDDSAFTTGPAAEFPTTPAEELRNPRLSVFIEKYDGTPFYRQRSRAGSFVDGDAAGSAHGGPRTDGYRNSTSELYRMDTWAGPSSRRVSVERSVSPARPGRRATLEPPKQNFFGSPKMLVVTAFEEPNESQPGSSSGANGHPSSPTIVVSTPPEQAEGT